MNFNPDRIVVAEQLPPLENDRFLNKLSDKIENKLSAYRPNPEDFIMILKMDMTKRVSKKI